MALSPYKQAIAAIYDARARSYDHAGENAAWHLRLCDTLLRRAAVQVGDRVLDLATGTGTIALAAARRVGPQGLVVAVDLAPHMLAEAERKAARLGLSDAIAFHRADAEDFRSELRFDHAFCCAALVWMGDMDGRSPTGIRCCGREAGSTCRRTAPTPSSPPGCWPMWPANGESS